VYQTTAPIWPGSSGGPLIHKSTGEVVAINSASYLNQEAIGFSILIQQVVSFIDKWIQHPMTSDEMGDAWDVYEGNDVWDIPEEAYPEYEDGNTEERKKVS
jgi:serine protease Do